MSIIQGTCDFLGAESEPTVLRITVAAAVAVPLSYVIYRTSRTVVALLLAIYLYLVRPIFFRFNTKHYVNRWTVVTGSTDGIGRAYTLELARRGLRRFILIGRSATKLSSVRKELESMYDDCEVQVKLFDFFDGNFDWLRSTLSDVDIGLAVNSVGIGREMLERYGETPAADTQLLRVNGVGAAEFLSCILPPMERHGGGQIVVLSSSQGIQPIPMLASYSATKALLRFLCECIDREYSTINVQCLTPTLIATKMTYYSKSSLFVVSAENFARQAVSVLGAVHLTSGCFNHEIQMLLNHMFPWTVLKYMIMPIYWLQRRRLVKLQGGQTSQPICDSTNSELERRQIPDLMAPVPKSIYST